MTCAIPFAPLDELRKGIASGIPAGLEVRDRLLNSGHIPLFDQDDSAALAPDGVHRLKQSQFLLDLLATLRAGQQGHNHV